jgi:hypothetical protein
MRTSIQFLLEEIENIKKMMKPEDGAMARTYVSVIESHAMYLLDLNKKEISDAWLDGQGNIPHFSAYSSDDYADADDYIKHTFPTL